MPLNFTASMDNTAFMRGIRGMQGAISKLSVGVAAAAVAMNRSLNFAGDIQDSADAVGLGVEQYQRLIGVLEQSGVSSQKAERSLVALTNSIQEARDGSEKTIAAFETLGVSWGELSTMSPDEVFSEIADGLASAEDRTKAVAAASDILGKGSARLIAVLSQGSDQLNDMMGRVSILTEAEVARLDEVGDRATSIMRRLSVGAGQYASDFLVRFDELGKNIADGVGLTEALRQAFTQPLPSTGLNDPSVPASVKGSEGSSPQASVADPRLVKMRENLDAAMSKGMRERGELAEKIAEMELDLAKEIGNAEYERIEQMRAFYVDGLEGEQKIMALEEDRLEILRLIEQNGIDELSSLTRKLALKEREIAQEQRIEKEKAKQAAIDERVAQVENLQNQSRNIIDSYTQTGLSGPDARRQAARDAATNKREENRTNRLLRGDAREGRAFQRQLSGGGIPQVLINEKQIKDLVSSIRALVNVP